MSKLISDTEALIALKNGEEVEYLEDDNKWHIIDKEIVVISALLDCKLRLKPRTITINGIEVPAPFEPKDGDEVWFIDVETSKGYNNDVYGRGCEDHWIQFGAWRSKEEIQKVVEALHSIFK